MLLTDMHIQPKIEKYNIRVQIAQEMNWFVS